MIPSAVGAKWSTEKAFGGRFAGQRPGDNRRVLLAGMRPARNLMRSSALTPFFDKETAPCDDVQSDDQFLDFAQSQGTTVYHLIGTAKMGLASDREAVVDGQLRVYGIQSLRVVDASIMPTMPSVNTSAAVLMIAGRPAPTPGAIH